MKKLLSPAALFVYAAIITFIIIKVKRRKENYA